jgi:hypothetical protein
VCLAARQVRDLAMIVASEVVGNAEAGKVLSFILYREQIPSNRRACLPTGPKAHTIYTDVLDACLRVQVSHLFVDHPKC